jgi:large subunit ribosomal protein L25
MPEIVVAAQGRTETGKNANRRLRAQGLIPGVVYGAKKEAPAHVAVSPKAIAGVLRSASGENTLFDLELAGTRRKVILKDYHIQPLHNTLLHADFYEVALDKVLTLTVHVELQGVPVGVKTQGGLLDFVTRELEVSCLPADIPEKIAVDVSELALGKHVRVSDLQPPKGVTFLTEGDIVVAHVVTPRAEVAAEAAAAPEAAAAEPEVAKKGKADEDKADKKGDAKAEKKEKK